MWTPEPIVPSHCRCCCCCLTLLVSHFINFFRSLDIPHRTRTRRNISNPNAVINVNCLLYHEETHTHSVGCFRFSVEQFVRPFPPLPCSIEQGYGKMGRDRHSHRSFRDCMQTYTPWLPATHAHTDVIKVEGNCTIPK